MRYTIYLDGKAIEFPMHRIFWQSVRDEPMHIVEGSLVDVDPTKLIAQETSIGRDSRLSNNKEVK